jgi:hypothetical protein
LDGDRIEDCYVHITNDLKNGETVVFILEDRNPEYLQRNCTVLQPESLDVIYVVGTKIRLLKILRRHGMREMRLSYNGEKREND